MLPNQTQKLIKVSEKEVKNWPYRKELKSLAEQLKNASVGIEQMIARHFPGLKNESAEGAEGEFSSDQFSEKTNKLINYWKSSVYHRFFAEPGASRDYIYRGYGEDRHLEKATNQTLIANRGALVSLLKSRSLPNLLKFAEGLVDDPRQEKLKVKTAENKSNPNQKVFTIDISRLKAIDTAGEGDYLLNEVAQTLINACDRVSQMEGFKDEKGKAIVELLPFRPGGDEFTMVLTADDPEILQKLVDAVNQVVIEDSIKKIKTQYGIANSENVIEVVEGNVEIKYGKPIDESRPLIEDSNEESQIKALLYDLILCEINLVPDPDHLNNAFKDVENYGDPTTPLTDRFKDYFKSHWETVLERETSLPDYCEYVINENNEKVAAIDKETLLLDAEALCAKFPGVQILVDIAKKADKYVSFDYINHFYPDLIAGPYKRPSDIFSEDEEVIIINGVNIPEEVRNFNLRSLIQLLSDNLFDPVVGEKVYNKHAFDELVKYEQLSGLVVFKEVIKPVNDNLGLANGDKVIRDFFHSIRAQIPAELEKYIIYGRGQADILIGFNRNEIDKISDENDRLSVISQINQTIDNLGQMQTFESLIEKNKENIKFTMNTGVGAAKLDPQTGALVPAEMGKCFYAAETDYDLKYVSLILKNNPAKICKTLLLKPDITDKLNSDPDLWNLHKYLNDPKRGVINTSRILKNLKENISQLAQYLNIADLQAEIVLLEESLTQLRRKLEIERTIRQLENENTELEKNLGNNNLTDKLPRLKIAVNINELAYQERMLDDLNSEVEKEFDKIESNRIFA